MLRAYAQLVRLPNLFTAWADILLGWLVVGGSGSGLGLALAASSCLYTAGMVLNDFFDAAVDARERPQRPIPSGRISRRTAGFLGLLLLLAGVAFAALLPGPEDTLGWPIAPPLAVSLVLAFCIVLYDGVLKVTPVGPVVMGTCRFLNVLLALCSPGYWPAWRLVWPAAGVGLYIVGVTWFARKEAETSSRATLSLGVGFMVLAVLTATAAPVALQQHLGPGSMLYPLALIAWGTVIGVPLWDALIEPTPPRVQRAVKTCILGLIGLDAVLAFGLVGWVGLLIVGLLLPATILGKWIYST